MSAEETTNSGVTAVIPLESNPQVFTDFGHKLGLSPLLSFFDIYSITEPELLSFLPRPVNAVVLLFPITDKYEDFKNSEESDKQISFEHNENITWFKQLLKNSCGLYALLHSICNLPSGLIVDQSKLHSFIEELSSGSFSDSSDEISKRIVNLSLPLYNIYSREGDTAHPNAEEDVILHFICYVRGNDNHYYELDGRRNGPVDLGAEANPELDLIDSEVVTNRIKTYMDMADEENKYNFAMMGLGPNFD